MVRFILPTIMFVIFFGLIYSLRDWSSFEVWKKIFSVVAVAVISLLFVVVSLMLFAGLFK